MKNRLVRALTLLAVVCIAATPASAQWKFGGALGAEHESSWDEFLVLTFEARRPISQWSTELAPRFSYFLRDGVTRFQIDANLLKPLELATPKPFIPYIGLGAALEVFSAEGFDQNSVGFNYVVGATRRTSGNLELYGQFQYTVLNDAPNTALVGVGLLYRR
jgi:hypothetical protein